MPTARYFIVRDQDDWLINYEGEQFGPYKTQNEAMVFAIEAARKLKTYGEIAEVCLMGDDGHFRQEWSAGQAADPPAP